MTRVLDESSASMLREMTMRSKELLRKGETEALEIATAGIELASDLGDRSALGWNLYVAGASRVDAAVYAAAEADLTRALAISLELKDDDLEVSVRRSLLKCAFFVRDYEKALLHGVRALERTRTSGDEGAEALVRNDLAIVYGNVGGLEEALEHLLAGLRLLPEQKAARLASHLNNIGNVYLELEDYDNALQYFTSARDEFRKQGMWRGEAIALGNRGRALSGLDRRAEAVDELQASLSVLEEHGDIAYRASASARLATALAAVGRHEEARLLFARALEQLMRSLHREFQDEVFTALGRYHLERGRYNKAIQWLNRALAVLPPDEHSPRVHDLHLLLSTAFEGLGDLLKALHHYREFHRINQVAADRVAAIRLRGLMFQFDVDQARQREELFRLRSVELVKANEELQALQAALEQSNAELRRLSEEDPLTGLRNRRQLDHHLNQEIGRAKRYGRPLCAAMCDLDHFKAINDRYSHGVGDEVLRRFAAILRQAARTSDFVARYGGEEFLLLLPETDLEGALALVERLRADVATHPWHELADDMQVTFSTGIAQMEPENDAEAFLRAADRNLYEAKRLGRDRIVS